jgi:hypothetical protein
LGSSVQGRHEGADVSTLPQHDPPFLQLCSRQQGRLIVSQALPKGLQTFDLIDGVWVTEPRCALAVAIALRESLIALSAARLVGEGQQTKMELVYQCLTGPRFRHRIEAVVERFAAQQLRIGNRRPARCCGELSEDATRIRWSNRRAETVEPLNRNAVARVAYSADAPLRHLLCGMIVR